MDLTELDFWFALHMLAMFVLLPSYTGPPGRASHSRVASDAQNHRQLI